jgi:hypothetical protein
MRNTGLLPRIRVAGENVVFTRSRGACGAALAHPCGILMRNAGLLPRLRVAGEDVVFTRSRGACGAALAHPCANGGLREERVSW